MAGLIPFTIVTFFIFILGPLPSTMEVCNEDSLEDCLRIYSNDTDCLPLKKTEICLSNLAETCKKTNNPLTKKVLNNLAKYKKDLAICPVTEEGFCWFEHIQACSDRIPFDVPLTVYGEKYDGERDCLCKEFFSLFENIKQCNIDVKNKCGLKEIVKTVEMRLEFLDYVKKYWCSGPKVIILDPKTLAKLGG